MRSLTAAMLILLVASAAFPSTKEPDMSRNDLRYRWNLNEIFPDDGAWEASRAALEARLDEVTACQGRLGENAGVLADCMDTYFDLAKELRRIMSYASMRSDDDTRNAAALAMRQKASTLATNFRRAASFLQPEILAMGRDRVASFEGTEPRLKVYHHFLEDILRRAPHTLSPEGESIVATAGMMAEGPSTLYSILANAEIPWPTVTLSDGTRARLDQAGYTRFRSAPNRADRKLVFDSFWSTWKAYERTMGVALYSQMKRDLFYAQVRHYPSCLAAALDGDHIPEAVYRTLIETTEKNLPTLHRYFKLRQRMLGLPDLRYYDIYPPLVKADLEFPIERGEELVLEAIRPLGETYQETVREGFQDRWMDVFPRPGKRSGAYSSGSIYDVHPFVLLNYTDDYESVSTLAHEWGHAMHSHLANSSQPFPTADYSIFVAEVASTFNEALLLEHMLADAKSDTERLFYLGSALEGLRGTFFRQTMFAAFELEIHEAVERGEALTGERLSQMYGELLRRYHGQDRGVVTIDDLYTVEWAYIPHFYYDFYVYQYATSIAASSLFAEEVLEGQPGARERYLSVLRAGGSQYPYELLKEAGVDLASPAPYEALIRRMNRIMDEIEEILARHEGSSGAS